MLPDPSLPSNAARRVVIFPLHCLSPLLRFLWIAEDNAAGLPEGSVHVIVALRHCATAQARARNSHGKFRVRL